MYVLCTYVSGGAKRSRTVSAEESGKAGVSADNGKVDEFAFTDDDIHAAAASSSKKPKC
jgi:hypothetical protein